MIALSKKNDLILNIAIITVTTLFIVLQILFSSGGIQPDSIQYFLQAQNFWEYKVNFPLGYSFLIKTTHYLTGSYIISSKIINLLSYLSILLFSYKKKFFFSGTVLVFSLYPFVNLYPTSLSEPVYYLVNYLIIYTIYGIVTAGFTKKYYFISFLLFFLLVSIRFSGIFVFASSVLFLLYGVYRQKYAFRGFILYLLASASGVLSYLLVNYLYCGFLLGQRDHLHIIQPSFLSFVSAFALSVARDFSFLNIFIHKGISNMLSFMNVGVGLLTIVIALLIMIRKREKLSLFSIYLFISFLCTLAGIVYTYYITKVDDTIRVKSNAYLYLLFFLALNVPRIPLLFFKMFVIISSSINSVTLIKHSDLITGVIKKCNALICPHNSGTVNIIYRISPAKTEDHSNARILLFKSLLIDKNYRIRESQGNSDSKVTECTVKASDITK